MEQWCLMDFKETREIYERWISDLGNVCIKYKKNRQRNTYKNDKITKGCLNKKDGYYSIKINKNDYKVHRLVLKYFIEEPPKIKLKFI